MNLHSHYAFPFMKFKIRIQGKMCSCSLTVTIRKPGLTCRRSPVLILASPCTSCLTREMTAASSSALAPCQCRSSPRHAWVIELRGRVGTATPSHCSPGFLEKCTTGLVCSLSLVFLHWRNSVALGGLVLPLGLSCRVGWAHLNLFCKVLTPTTTHLVCEWSPRAFC